MRGSASRGSRRAALAVLCGALALACGRHPDAETRAARPKNVLLLVADTLRAGAAYFANEVSLGRTWRNRILWNNTAPGGTAIEVLRGPLDVAWCDVQGGQASVWLGASAHLAWGAGNFDLDPQFVDPDGADNDPLTIADNDYRLSLASPCLDAGENASVALDSFDLDGDGNVTEPVPFDFDGNARFVEIPSAPNTGSGTPPLVDLGAWERP